MIIFLRDGLRESNVTTKYFDVNDMYSENYPNEYSDNEESLNRTDKSPVSLFYSLNKITNYPYVSLRNELHHLIRRKKHVLIMIIVEQIRLINRKMKSNEHHGKRVLMFKVALKVQSRLLIMLVHKLIFGVHQEEIGLMN